MKKLKLRIVMLGPSLNQNGGIATIENLLLRHISPEIKIQHITSHDEGSIKYRIVVFGKALGKLLWVLLRRKADLVHLHVSERGSVVRKVIFTLIAFLFRKPVLLHTHGAEFHLFYHKLPTLAQQWLGRILRRCSYLIVLSRTWKDFFVIKLGVKAERVFVLPNCVELPTKLPNRTNTTKVNLVFFGRVGQRKGAFDLIKAFANLPIEQKKRSQLTLAGDGDVEQGRMLAASLNLKEYVTFLGWVNPERRNKILAEADVFVLPSYNEGLPMALLEAMAWVLPVITTPVGGIPELVTSDQNGLLVNPGNIQQLSKAMQSLIEDETLRLSLGSTARQTVTHFDVKSYCYELANIYYSVLGTEMKTKF